jgi:hypothetical protein
VRHCEGMLHGGKHMVLSMDSLRRCGSLGCDVLDGFDLNCLLAVLRAFACNVKLTVFIFAVSQIATGVELKCRGASWGAECYRKFFVCWRQVV